MNIVHKPYKRYLVITQDSGGLACITNIKMIIANSLDDAKGKANVDPLFAHLVDIVEIDSLPDGWFFYM